MSFDSIITTMILANFMKHFFNIVKKRWYINKMYYYIHAHTLKIQVYICNCEEENKIGLQSEFTSHSFTAVTSSECVPQMPKCSSTVFI